MRKCPDIAKQEIKRLQKNGINPTLDELAWMMSLGEKVQNPPRLGNPLLAGVPVVAGCEPFFELTNHAAWWLELVSGWFQGIEICHMLGFVHRYARTPKHFESLVSPELAREAVRKWRDSISITDAEILDATGRFTDNDKPDTEDDNKESACQYGETMALALAISNITRDEYELMTPEQSSEIIKQAILFGADNAEAGKIAAGKEAGRAMLHLMLAVKEVEKAHNGE